jgi:membrane fusion protein, heavy metal efflux system
MLRQKTISATAAASAIVIGSLAFWLHQPTALFASTPPPRPVVSAVSGGLGAHGGTVLTQGTLALELVSSTQSDGVQLTIYVSADGKLLDTSKATLTGTITHYDGSKHTLQFTRTNQRFALSRTIPSPQVFEVALEVRTNTETASFLYARTDGTIALTQQQIATSGIGIARAAPGVVKDTFQLPGEIRLNEDRTAHIVPRVGGVVDQVPVSLGQHVRKGQLLAVISSADLSSLRSELLGAERRLVAARATYAREKSLWEEKISAQQDYQQALTQLREAAIATENAREKLRALNAPPAARSLNRYELRAPFEGTIAEKHLAAGEAVAADAKVMVLTDLSTVWAEMAVPAQRLDQVQVGHTAQVRVAGFESQASGKISYVGALLGEQTRTAPARVVLANPDGRWRPGLFVQVSVEAGERQAAVTVAADALQEYEGRSTVFVRTPAGFLAKSVTVGRRDEQTAEIVKGMKAGEAYASSNSFLLKAELGKSSAAEN